MLFQKGYIGQWYPSRFYENGQMFSCAEQYMMYRKAILFNDYKTATEIMMCSEPKVMQDLGRRTTNFNQQLWDDNKEQIVFKGNFLKFSQNEILLKKLLLTKGYELAEAAPWDKIWGIGLGPEDSRSFDKSLWEGENLLGKTITKVRKVLEKVDII